MCVCLCVCVVMRGRAGRGTGEIEVVSAFDGAHCVDRMGVLSHDTA